MIARIASHLPASLLTNEELAREFPVWTAEQIFQKTGIRSRHTAAPGECASDLAVAAAEKLLVGTDRAAVDFLLFCSQSPDYVLPTTACLLQHRLGLSTRCGAVDFNLGCSGYIYGLALAHGLLTAGLASGVLLLTADTYTRLLAPGDKATRTVFGDGAAATLLRRDSGNRLHGFVFGTDGAGADLLMVKEGGLRFPTPMGPTAEPGLARARAAGCSALVMNGPEIYNFTLQAVPRLIAGILTQAGLAAHEVDYYVFHQANAFMLEGLRRKLGIPAEKFEVSMEHCGNTVSATIPLALEAAWRAGRIRPGMKVLLAGFGVGLSWAGCILEINQLDIYDAE